MTREDRWIVSLDEIRAIRLECQQCHVALSYVLTETVRLPQTCPSCSTDLIDTFAKPAEKAYGAFVESLKAIMRLQQGGGRAALRLEFVGDSTARRVT